MAIILLPALKIKTRSPRGPSFQDEVHAFFLSAYSGYTVAAGNITGYWKDRAGRQQYGEHLQYRVALAPGPGLRRLEWFLAQLAAELGEQSLYLEIGREAWLILATEARGRPRPQRQSRSTNSG